MTSAAQIARALDPKAKKLNGGSWSCRCPAHEDEAASLSLSDSRDGSVLWHCHAGCSREAVRRALADRGLLPKPNGSAGAARTKPVQTTADDWRPMVPPPAGVAEPAFSHQQHGKPSAVWTYRDGEGQALFYVRRFDQPDGRKQIVPLTYGRLNGKACWHARHPPTPRPLYGLDRLAAHPEAPVVLVEGEKAADTAAELLPDLLVTT